MNEDDSEREIARVERERRNREDELLILLLLLLWRAQRDATTAAIHGYSAGLVIRSLISGNPATGHRGAVPLISRSMAQAHRDGFRRAGLMVGTRDVLRTEAGTLADLALVYRDHAQTMADAIASTLAEGVDAAVSAARFAGETIQGIRQAVKDAFERLGYTRTNSYAAEVGVERAVVAAHNSGVFAAARGGAEMFTGVTVSLRHVSVLDSRTTTICEERDGLTLPVNDIYWFTNVPPLHPNCRSILRVLLGDFEASQWRPSNPPMQGFGRAPEGLLESLTGH